MYVSATFVHSAETHHSELFARTLLCIVLSTLLGGGGVSPRAHLHRAGLCELCSGWRFVLQVERCAVSVSTLEVLPRKDPRQGIGSPHLLRHDGVFPTTVREHILQAAHHWFNSKRLLFPLHLFQQHTFLCPISVQCAIYCTFQIFMQSTVLGWICTFIARRTGFGDDCYIRIGNVKLIVMSGIVSNVESHWGGGGVCFGLQRGFIRSISGCLSRLPPRPRPRPPTPTSSLLSFSPGFSPLGSLPPLPYSSLPLSRSLPALHRWVPLLYA